MIRVVLLSSERSGSNLLRRILGHSAAIAAPPAPQLLKAFAPHWPVIPRDEETRRTAAQLATRLLETHLVPWKYLVSAEEVLARTDASGWDYPHLLDACYGAYAEEAGKLGYFAKENNAFDFAFPIALRLPDVKFVYLVRDPRDMVLSYMKAPGGPKTAWYAARQWYREQVQCLRVVDELPDRCCVVRYEELVREPEETVRSLCEFLGIVYDPAMLSPQEADREASKASRYWENLGKPILSNNTDKYLREMPARNIRVVEAFCESVMRRLGYECVTPAGKRRVPGRSRRLFLTVWEQLLRRLLYQVRVRSAEEKRVRSGRAAVYRAIRELAKTG